MIGAQLAVFMQQVLANPYVAGLIGELAGRQPGSLAGIEQLRQASFGGPALWPFHAIQLPLQMQHASGSSVVDVDGREYLDLFLGFGTAALHGHNPPEVVEAVRSGLGRTVGNGYFHGIEIELVQLLRELAPLNEGFVFLNSGTDATAAAVRLCRAATGKRLVVKFESAVHGTHDWGVQSSVALMHGHPVTPWPERTREGVRPVPFVTGVAPASPDELLILPDMDPGALAVLEARKDDIACVIAESCNISFPFPERCVPFVRALGERCRDLGILFVLDEVQTGFRWGSGGAAGAEGIPCDLRTYGKVLSGLGIPLSAVGGRADLLAHTRTNGVNLMDYGAKTTFMTTHMGNHLALLASHASLSLLRDKGPAYYERVRERRDRLRARLAPLREEGIPMHLVGYGDFIGTFLFVEGPEQAGDARALTERANPAATLMFSLALRREGIYTYSWPFVFLGDAYSDEDIDRIGDVACKVAREIRDAGIPMEVPWLG